MKEVSPSILIVEHENGVARDLEQSLAGLGYRIAGVVDSGHQAIEVAERVRPDLALVDTRLAGEVGSFKAAGEIRNRLKIPIVLLTAKPDGGSVEETPASDAYSYLARPYRSAELEATIALALNQHRLVQEIFADESWLATMVQNLQEAVIATDANGRVAFLNPPAEVLTGWSLENAIGLPIEQICAVTARPGEKGGDTQLQTVLRTGEATALRQGFLSNQAGETGLIEESAVPIVQHGQVLGAVAIFRSVTEARKQQVLGEVPRPAESDGQALSKHLINSQEERGRRLAKNLHDDFSQRTALLGLQIDYLYETLQESEDVREKLRAMRVQLGELSEGLRRTSHELYPSVLSDLGLLPALRELIHDSQGTGLDVRLRTKSVLPVEMPKEIAIALYRIAEEAIEGASEHARDAHVQISVSVNTASIQMTIEDTGAVSAPADARSRDDLRLLIMQERARMAGGSLFVATRAGQRIRVIVRVPIV